MSADAAAQPFEALDLSVLGAGRRHLWISARSRQGEVHGVPRPLPRFAAAIGQADLASWFGQTIGQARRERERALAVGAMLRDLLFGVPEIAALLEQTRGVAAERGAQLLLRLLVAPSEIAAWPWELVVDPQHPGRFLALARDAHLLRTPRARTYPARVTPVAPPLNMLLVLSSPLRTGQGDDEAVFDLYAEKRALLAELQPLVDRGLLHVVVEERPSVERLRSRMARERRGFHVMHYLGHARPDGLKLEDPDGRGRLVRCGDFSRLLQELPDLRLAVFAGCETARAPAGAVTGGWTGQLSMTDHCVRDASPAVVGMQAVLPFGTERLFTRFFYQSLTAGRPIAEAMRLARLAIEGDDHVGRDLLDWAVPCLVVGGGDPGPLIDPAASAAAPQARRRVSLRLGARQSDRRFFARQTELRLAIDVMAGQSGARLLQIVGGSGVGKSRLLDRAVDELDADVARLALPLPRLLAAADAVEALCLLLEEVLRQAGHPSTAREGRGAEAWWERLLEDLTELRLAIALDDADVLSDAAPDARTAALRQALHLLLQRRGQARLAVASATELKALAEGLPASTLRLVRLQPLAWPEVWHWIRRNLPVLTRWGDAALAPYFADLGAELELWAELADAIEQRSAAHPDDLPALVRDVALRLASRAPGSAPMPPPVFGGAPGDLAAPSAAPLAPATGAAPLQPLRVAIAGPYTDGRGLEFSRGLTALAAQLGVGGRVVPGGAADASSSLAQLLDLRSPFDARGQATLAACMRWLAEAQGRGADIVLLDFGAPQPSRALQEVVLHAAAAGSLVVAAGSPQHVAVWPAWYPEVLAVGALQADGEPAPYNLVAPELGKPELFAPESVAGSALAPLPRDADARGPTFAALHVAAAAALVWASDRSLHRDELRQLLLDSARVDAAGRRRLDTAAALASVRRRLLLDALEAGPLDSGRLLAETGLRAELALPLLDAMRQDGVLHRVLEEGVEAWEHVHAIYRSYEQLRREAPSSPERTAAQTRLTARIAQLARRRDLEAEDIRAMWASGRDGRRIVALAAMQARPELRDLDRLLDAIGQSRSAFEQYTALRLAEAMLPDLAPPQRERLRAVVGAQCGPGGWIQRGGDRWAVAEGLLKAIAGP